MKLIGKNTLAPFDWFLILGSLAFYILHWWLVSHGYSGNGVDFSLLGAVAGMSGLICNVLCAKRNITNYFFGIINVTLYAYIAWQNKIYGDVALNMLYYFPMQFVGFFTWWKNRKINEQNLDQKEGLSSKDETAVVAKKLSSKQRIFLLFGTLFSILIVGYILKIYTQDPQPFKDSATTIISIIAMWLMVALYMEQWWLWIAVNVISTIMWVYMYQQGGESSGEMIIKWFFNLANSINGYIIWNKASKNKK